MLSEQARMMLIPARIIRLLTNPPTTRCWTSAYSPAATATPTSSGHAARGAADHTGGRRAANSGGASAALVSALEAAEAAAGEAVAGGSLTGIGPRPLRRIRTVDAPSNLLHRRPPEDAAGPHQQHEDQQRKHIYVAVFIT